jgi:uncharacterized membrane protein YfcA
VIDAREVALLSAMLGAGFFVEAVAGFGGTVVAVSLGATHAPIAHVLAVFLPLNLCLSAYLALRHRHAVRGRLLGRRILPAMLVGLAGGTALALAIDGERAKLGFAALVMAVALRELVRLARPEVAAPAPLPAPAQVVILLGAGVVHGLYATGGPLAVAVANRVLGTKAELRATLAVLWLSLNLIVLGRLVAHGDLTPATLALSASIAPALGTALVLGEVVHRRVSERGFRWLVALLLLGTGAVLFVRSY